MPTLALLLQLHLDPFGSCVPYIDAAVARVPNNGVITLTSTDTSTLYAHYPQVAQRHYGVAGLRRFYFFSLFSFLLSRATDT